MKQRACAFLLILVLLFGTVCSGKAEGAPQINSYEFDLRFHLETENVPKRRQEYMQGYAELLDMLELKGNISWCDETHSFDMSCEIIPLTNPSASIFFRLYGLQNSFCLSSPLFGDEPIFLDQYGAVNSGSYIWSVTGIPFPLINLFNPYTAMYALQNVVATWRRQIPSISKIKKITVRQLQSISDSWKEQLQNDMILDNWLSGIIEMIPEKDIVYDALNSLPDELLKIAGKKDLSITKQDNALICMNAKKQTVFTETEEDGFYSFELNLPETDSAYQPAFSYVSAKKTETSDMKLKITWNQNKTVINTTAEEEAKPESLLNLELNLTDMPLIYPSDASMKFSLSMGGCILPQMELKANIKTTSKGDIRAYIINPDNPDGNVTLTCTGSVIPATYNGELAFILEELVNHPTFFVSTYRELGELTRKIASPFIKGILSFVYELPTRACQNLMDALESYGILETLMKGL